MRKRVIITLMEGSFEHGFPVILRIREDGTFAETGIQILGKLPPAPDILKLFQDWQSTYHHMVMPHSRLKPKPSQVTNFSCHQLGNELEKYLNNWLNSGVKDWQKIRDGLQRNLRETDEIHVIIETDDIRMRRLPWHSWDLFSNHYTKAEIALSTVEYQPPRGKLVRPTKKVNILAILGDSTGIDLQKDRAVLGQLPNAKITFLVEPQRQELNNMLWEQKWQIIFFAGHSFSESSGDTGKIYINRNNSLSITEFKNALNKAIANGLQLAIFNSCDGLGLARELADLHIPQIIIMREPVPDLVAQEFLKHFLTSFAKGKSLYLAVREARERLQGLEEQFPFASWLPVICQNPAKVPTTWEELLGRTAKERKNIIQNIYKAVFPLLILVSSTWVVTTTRNTFPEQFSTSTPTVLCSGDSCIGRDPRDNKCDLDAKTITSTVGDIKIVEDKIATFKVELRYSPTCNSTWARTIGSFILTDYLAFDYLEDHRGQRYGQAKVLATFAEHYGDMGPGNTDIRACIQSLNGESTCTNFVKP